MYVFFISQQVDLMSHTLHHRFLHPGLFQTTQVEAFIPMEIPDSISAPREDAICGICHEILTANAV
jgi:hypothetical protein